jgi:hypothetical protein
MAVPIARLYILKTFAKFLGLSLFIFASLLVMLNFVQIVNQGALAGFSFYFLAKTVFYMLPNILAMSRPDVAGRGDHSAAGRRLLLRRHFFLGLLRGSPEFAAAARHQ